MLIDSEQAYSRFNEEYKKAKFGNIENFNNYINSNKNILQMIYNVETADSSDFGSFLEYDLLYIEEDGGGRQPSAETALRE